LNLTLPEELNNVTSDICATSDHILLVICCSSTGQGEFPENVAQFFAEISGKNLSHVDFIVLCLGDSNYTSFMEAPHRLVKRLVENGAHLVAPLYEADDSNPDSFGDVTDQFVESSPKFVEDWVRVLKLYF